MLQITPHSDTKRAGLLTIYGDRLGAKATLRKELFSSDPNVEYVDLFCDVTTMKIGIVPTLAPGVNSYKLSKTKNTYDHVLFSAAKVMQALGVDPPPVSLFEVEGAVGSMVVFKEVDKTRYKP
jgi:hypothetical protein